MNRLQKFLLLLLGILAAGIVSAIVVVSLNIFIDGTIDLLFEWGQP